MDKIELTQEELDAKLLDAKASVKDELLNDAEFLGSIPKEKLPQDWFDTSEQISTAKKEFLGRAVKKTRGVFALNDEEYAKISEESKGSYEDYISKVAEVLSERQGNSSEAEIRKQLDAEMKASFEYKDKIADLEKKLEELPQQYEEKFNQRIGAENLKNTALSNTTALQDHLPVKASLLFPSIWTTAQAKYDLALVGNTIEVYSKGTTNKVKNDNTKDWTVWADVVKEVTGSDWVESKKKPTTTVTQTITPAAGTSEANSTEYGSSILEQARQKD